MSEWKPIEIFDALPEGRRPRLAVFYYPVEQSGRTWLAETIQNTRNYGRRMATLWMPLPTPPEDSAS